MPAIHGSAAETLRVVDQGSFDTDAGRIEFAAHRASAVAGTRLFGPQHLAALTEPAPGFAGQVTVLDATTQEAAATWAPDVALLNFASARNVGGGFLGGAKAQEEDLCRCSALFRCLETQPDYYRANRAHRSTLYTDHLIWSPAVPFFRLRGNQLPHRLFLAGVITAPAPNRGPMLANEPDSIAALPDAFARRWRHVLAVAASTGHRRLVLGAWGCGAFGNDPYDVATAFQRAWPPWAPAFDEVVFAIPSSGARSKDNLAAFRSVLAS